MLKLETKNASKDCSSEADAWDLVGLKADDIGLWERKSRFFAVNDWDFSKGRS